MSTDAIESLYILFGLDKNKSMWQQYLDYWAQLFHGDLGTVVHVLPHAGLEVLGRRCRGRSALVGVDHHQLRDRHGLGVLAGWRRGSWVDGLLPVTTFLSSIPYFWLGPHRHHAVRRCRSAGSRPRWATTPALVPSWDVGVHRSAIQHSLLPAMTDPDLVGQRLDPRHAQHDGHRRSEDYITVAHAKGLSERRVMLGYAARNALLPNVSGFALSLGFIVGGTLLVEIVFSYPGLGYLLFQAVARRTTR